MMLVSCGKAEKNYHSKRFIFNATVSKHHRAGAYTSITEALAAAPTSSHTKYYIHIEAGVYVEQVVVKRILTNIVLVGDGADTTKLQWNLHAPNYSTFNSATLTVGGNGFIAMFMAFENTAGNGFQAVAVATVADQVVYYKCTFLGYQDTLYAKSGVQLYKNCDIYGTVDFICGAAAAVFQSCNLYARSPNTIAFTAQSKDGGRSDPSGFMIQDCVLTVAPGLGRIRPKAYLGRPWSNYSTVVVMESYLDDMIQPDGWLGWGDTPTNMLTYLEFRNRGGGKDTTRRVNWRGYKDVSGRPDIVRSFTIAQFIDRDRWLAGTGIPYSSGFMHN
ncbi:hypothetical protein C2S51_009684 [Perilla frutescens var. frutescens]|nr:hypothetical protein C2S51_009684 [Perilla frutescens var. frutescens]